MRGLGLRSGGTQWRLAITTVDLASSLLVNLGSCHQKVVCFFGVAENKLYISAADI